MTTSLPAHMSDTHVIRTAPPLVTSRSLWVGTYALTIGATLLRLPALERLARDSLSQSDLAQKVTDPTMRAVAVDTGLWLALVLTLVIVAIYFSLTSVMERHLLAVKRGSGRLQIGLLFSVAALSTLPVQLWCAATGSVSVRGTAPYFGYLLMVAIACPLGFLPTLRRVSPARRAAAWLLALSVAMLSYVL